MQEYHRVTGITRMARPPRTPTSALPKSALRALYGQGTGGRSGEFRGNEIWYLSINREVIYHYLRKSKVENNEIIQEKNRMRVYGRTRITAADQIPGSLVVTHMSLDGRKIFFLVRMDSVWRFGDVLGGYATTPRSLAHRAHSDSS